jgi:bacteriocin-like protein
MSDLNINDINSTGAELFADSESFLQELSDDEMMNISGGLMVASTESRGCGSVTSNETSGVSIGCTRSTPYPTKPKELF